MDGSPWTPMLFAWAPWYLAYGVYYLAFCIPALFVLRGRVLDDTSRAVWALAIVLAPIMGALALVIIQPGPREG